MRPSVLLEGLSESSFLLHFCPSKTWWTIAWISLQCAAAEAHCACAVGWARVWMLTWNILHWHHFSTHIDYHHCFLQSPPVCPACHFCVPALGASGKEPACPCRTCRRCPLHPWVRNVLWRRKWQPTPAFLPGESHGQRSLVGYRPLGGKESDPTEAT